MDSSPAPSYVSQVPETNVNADQRTFGDNVRAVRKQAGFTQEGLAAAAGLDRGYVGGVENGRRNISLNAMWKLARAIGVTPAAFFATTADEEPIEPVGADR